MDKSIISKDEMLPFNRKIAKVIGLNEAIVLSCINRYLLENERKNINYIYNRYWISKSIKDWQKNDFSFWSEKTVKRIFSSLEGIGLLIGYKFEKINFDHTKWYTINYEELENIILRN
ncbi:hypothetical protein [Peptacetobacter sp.]|uniref:hypothetical protein n=1 Tax=Peptacetobacter sp. TaxID=2991975 RepID=UPI003AB64485